MAHTLNFNNAPKKYMTVTLNDEPNTVLMISTPSKSLLDDLLALHTDLEALTDRDNDDYTDAMDNLYNACAKVMSRNKAGKVITKELLSDILDIEDVIIFFNAYLKFVQSVTGSKN